MHAASTSTRRARARHRHSLHTLTYVVLDDANGGVIRDLNHQGVAVQAVIAPPLHHLLRVRFELRHPRVKVDSMGEVVWADASGQCGIRFLNLPSQTVRQINEWIFADLLDSIPSRTNSIFGAAADTLSEEDGLLLSPAARKVIQLQPPGARGQFVTAADINPGASPDVSPELDWLSRPLSGRQIAWMLNSLIVVAALLLFSLVFLAVAQELPRWPLDLETGSCAAILVIAFYWFFFRVLGGSSMGARLARLATSDVLGEKDARDSARFR
jgi:hypothetical protein